MKQRTETRPDTSTEDENNAQALARQLLRQHGHQPEFQGIDIEGDQVLVGLHVGTLDEWYAWWPLCGIHTGALRQVGNPPYAEIGHGHREGVPVVLIAHAVPELITRALAKSETAGGAPC